METIDIIIASYNCEKYIEEAIRSVKKQTYLNWHLIIVDDFSTDNTRKILQKLDNESKIEIIKLAKHKGVAEARNIGIEKSKNKYIAFLDADDVWKENKLEKQLKFMQKNDYNFTYTSFSYKRGKRKKEVGNFPKKLNYKQALKNTFILTSTVMINTEKISKKLVKMPNIESEDTATWWNILKNNNIAYGLKESLTIYRVHKKRKIL